MRETENRSCFAIKALWSRVGRLRKIGESLVPALDAMTAALK